MNVALPLVTLRIKICPEGNGDIIDYVKIKIFINREGVDQAVVHKVGRQHHDTIVYEVTS
jgi:hypothetical protein